MAKRKRKHYSPEEKTAILRKHFLEKAPVSDLCDQHGLHPTMFHRWQKGVFRERGGGLQKGDDAPAEGGAGADLEAGGETDPQERRPVGADGGARPAKKRTWGALKAAWVPRDVRDAVVDFVRRWAEKTELPTLRFIEWLGIAEGKFYDWRKRYGKANEHNAWVRGTTGWRNGRRRRSGTFTPGILWRGTGV